MLSIILCLLIPSIVECRFVSFYQLKHRITGQEVMLLGDCHEKEKYASENKAALINVASYADAHIIVEDMSDYSLLYDYVELEKFVEVDFFSLPSAHSDIKLAYTSLSITHHCKRRGISVSNIEFRHRSLDSLSMLPADIYLMLLDQLIMSIDDDTKALLDEPHREGIERVLAAVTSFYNDALPSIDQDSKEVVHIEHMLCLLLDALILQELRLQTRSFPEQMIIICAGDAHIDSIRTMLGAHDYIVKQSVTHDYYTMREIRLQPLFERYFYNHKDKKACISSANIKFNDFKRVWHSVARRIATFGTICAVSIATISLYVKSRYLEQHYQW